MKTFISDLSKNEFPVADRVSGATIRKPILKLICDDHPTFQESGCVSISELNLYRQKYIADFLATEVGELSKLEETVLSAMQNKETLVPRIEDTVEEATLGQRMADVVASFGGSWTFISCFAVFMLLWIVSNVVLLTNRGFDPYPFILLNLILSCLAALQAPIIMMSQNRQEQKDRERAKKDYMVNLKSELEIRLLHEKLDHLIMHQQQELIEIQKVQVEMMDDILERLGKAPHKN
jgi:uncharacterized membrane protein